MLIELLLETYLFKNLRGFSPAHDDILSVQVYLDTSVVAQPEPDRPDKKGSIDIADRSQVESKNQYGSVVNSEAGFN